MKQGLTDITIILDRSGSMSSVKDDTIGGFNEFLRTQKAAPGEAKVSLFQFDTEYEAVYEGKSIQEAPELTPETFVPRWGTAYLDAIGRTVNATGARFYAMPEEERPEKVVVVILTDGEENSSKEFTRREISALVSHQQDIYKWEFVFLGANLDAISEAQSISINPQNAMTYAANSQGTKRAFSSMSARMVSYRADSGPAAAASLGFTPEDREAQKEAGAKQPDVTSISEWLSNSRRPDLPK